MKQIFLSFCISLLCIGTASAQLVVNFSSAADVSPGGQVTVDVSVEDFDNIVLFQFGVLWDPTVLSYNSLTNVVGDPPLPDFAELGNIGTPTVSTLLEDGEIWTSWNEANTEQVSIPDGTILFSIVLDVIGDPCDETTFSVGEILGPVEVYNDPNFSTNIGVTSNDGLVSIDGDNCDGMGTGCDNFNGIILTIADVNAEQGENVCVPVTVENFTDIESATIGVTWNESIIDYDVVANSALPGSLQFNDTNTANGELAILWTEPLGNQVTLPDGSVIFEICFDAVGSVGQSSTVDFQDLPNIGTGFEMEFSSFSNAIPFCIEEGSVTIVGTMPDLFVISGNSVTADQNEQVCVDYTTENFNDISSIQLTFMWDNSVIDYDQVLMTNPDLGGLSPANFNQVADDKLRLTWNSDDGSGNNLPDGALLFKICYNTVGACEDDSDIMYVSFGGLDTEIGDGSGNSIPSSMYDLQPGNVTIVCPPDGCTISVTDVSCNGGNDGSIAVTFDGGSNPTCSWEKVGVGMIGSSCNLSGQTAGDYILTVTTGSNVTTKNATINEPDPIVVTAVTTDASCNGNGSVNLTVTGGNGGDTFSWDPPGSDPQNLPVGNYSVTATDSKMCTGMTSFSINMTTEPLMANVTATMTSCSDSSDGTISFSATGGCAPYTCSIGTSDCTGTFGPGSYNVTITDADGQSVTEEVFVTSPPAVEISLLNVTASNGADGIININGTGGTGQLNYSWTGPNNFTSVTQNINGLAPGDYTVCASDQNQCMVCETWNVPSVGAEPSITNVSSTGISCFEEACDGTIFATVANATNITINGLNATEVNQANLCAGEYVIVATNANGSATETIIVEDATEIEVEVDVFCAEEDMEDGSIELTVTGGNGPYTFNWGDPTIVGANPGFLAAGTYNVLIEDMNMCLHMEQNIEVETCTVIENDCFIGLNILTPNDDGMNDFLLINCAEQNEGTLTVYDRYGQDVYKEVGYSNGWDGRNNNGTLLNEGGYMWVLEVDFGNGDTRLYKGTVTILRNL